MARGINKVILVCTLGQDPEVRYTADGKAVANISGATNEQWTDKATGQKQEKTEWHRISMFGRLAEIAGEYLKKGSQVYIEGKLQTRKWQDQNGQDRYTTEIVANEMQMLGGGNAGGNPQRQPPAQQASQQQPPRQQAAPPAQQQPQQGGHFEDDIPFNRKHGMEGG